MSPRPCRILLPVALIAALLAGCSSDEGVTTVTVARSEPTEREPSSTVAGTDPADPADPADGSDGSDGDGGVGAAVETVLAGLDTTAVGPWQVGMRTVTIDSAPGRDRPLLTTIWYPAAPGSTGAPGRYEFLPGVGLDSELALADVPVAEGPFPVVVFSHGNVGLRYQSAFSTEHLASWGFVVVSADHPGDTAYDDIAGTWEGNVRHPRERILDMSDLLDAMGAAAVTPGDPFEGRLDLDRVGVYGHSMGGHTAVGSAVGLSVFRGGRAPADDRVDAIAGFGVFTELFTDDELASIDVPMLLTTGTDDLNTPIAPNVERPWALTSGPSRYRIDVLDGAHDVFTDICRYEEGVPTFTDPPEILVDYIAERADLVCRPGLPSWRAVQDMARRAIAAFFITALTPEAADAVAAQETLDALVPGGEVLLRFPTNGG